MAVFDVPDRGEDGLRVGPAEYARVVERKQGSQNFETAVDDCRVCIELRLFDGVAQQWPNFIFPLTHNTFWIDRYPSAFVVEENVVVLQISVQQHRPALCCREPLIQAASF